MLKGNEGPSLKCAACGVEIWPRVGGYWFLLLAPRGRVRFPGARTCKVVLCSGCGRRAREALESAGVGGGPAYRPAGSPAKPDVRKSRMAQSFESAQEDLDRAFGSEAEGFMTGP